MARTPGSNTIAYYPFDTNFNDYSGNNRNLTNSGFSISTYDGVKCAYQNSTNSYYMYNSSQPLTGNASFTISVRAKSVRLSSPFDCRILGFIGSSYQNRCLGFSEDTTNGFKIKIFNWGNDTTTSVTTSGKWEHIVLTKDGSTTKLYINGVQSWSGSYTLSLSGGYIGVGCVYGADTSAIQAWHGGLSKWILENKARTATEIQNYFNDTAWQYGLAPKPTIWHGSSPIKEMYYSTPSGTLRPSGKKGVFLRLNGNMTDESGNSHNGTGTANYTDGKFGQCYNASSSSFYVSVANSSDLYMTSGEKFSIGFRICPNYPSSYNGTMGVISMTRNVDSYTGWSIHNDSVSRNWQFRTNNGSLTSTQLSNLTWSNGEWFHFVLTYDGTTVRYYKNKELKGSFSYTVGNCATTYPLTVGYASTWSASGYAKYDDVFFIKDYCLSDDDIKAFYNGKRDFISIKEVYFGRKKVRPVDTGYELPELTKWNAIDQQVTFGGWGYGPLFVNNNYTNIFNGGVASSVKSRGKMSVPGDINTIGNGGATVTTTVPSNKSSWSGNATMAFNADGSVVYMNNGVGSYYKYNCNTPYDIANKTQARQFSLGINGRFFCFGDDGKKFYTNEDGITEYILSTPYEVTSSATKIGSYTSARGSYEIGGWCFSPTGKSMYVADYGASRIWRLDLTTAWDITTCTNATYKYMSYKPLFVGAYMIDGTMRAYTTHNTGIISRWIINE